MGNRDAIEELRVDAQFEDVDTANKHDTVKIVALAK